MIRDVVVIGGGVIGVSTLYHLARKGCSNTVLIERDELGCGSTGVAAGGIRAQFSDELNIRIALRCIESFRRFPQEFGVDIGFRQDGYLFLLREEHLAMFQASMRLQRSLGVPVELLSVADALRHVPGTNPEGLVGAAYCALDGIATPQAVVHGYEQAARRLGTQIIRHRAVTEILVEAGRVVGVRTAQGDIETSKVILTAGVWSADLARTAGLHLPVDAERRYVYYLDSAAGLPERTPLTIDFATGLYFHREGPGLILGGPWATAEEIAVPAVDRLPMLAEAGIVNSWSGLYEMSPDHNAMVGACTEPAGLFYGTGFSGHGFQQAPVIGDYLADLALDRTPALDLAAFSLSRFADQLPRPESNVI
jgi:sarcosine oxidase, subunit beta